MKIDYTSFFSSEPELVESSVIREILRVIGAKNVISLAGGIPDPETFPYRELAEIAYNVILEKGSQALQYAPTRGVDEFIEAVIQFSKSHGVKVDEDDGVIATVGSQEALYLLAEAILDPGDAVIVERPTYLAAIQVFRKRRARIYAVDVDDKGVKTELLEELLRKLRNEGVRVKLLYFVPTCQNPTGVTMSIERRKHVLEIASKYNLLVVEDDPYSYFVFEGARPTPLKTLDAEGRVVYLSTLSKILAPGLRLGWAIGPNDVISQMEKLKQHVNLQSSTLTQYIAAEALKRGVVDSRLPRLRELYRRKRDAMLEALEEYMPRGSRWIRPVGGFFTFLWLPGNIDTMRLLYRAIEHGVAYVPGSAFYIDGGGRNAMRLSYSYPSIEEIREGIRRLSEVVRRELGA